MKLTGIVKSGRTEGLATTFLRLGLALAFSFSAEWSLALEFSGRGTSGPSAEATAETCRFGCGSYHPEGTRYVDTIFGSVDVERDVRYSQGTLLRHETPSLTMDVYTPGEDIERQRPALILVDGGDLGEAPQGKDGAAMAKDLAMRGYVTAAMESRTKGDPGSEDPHSWAKAMAADIRAAIRFLRCNANEYGIDPQMISLGGSSAGATAALFVAYSSEIAVGDSPSNAGCTAEVAAVISLAGSVYYGDRPSPMEPDAPPLQHFHGTADNRVNRLEGLLLEKKCQLAGVPVELYFFEGAGHNLAWYMRDINDWTARFLYRRVVRKNPFETVVDLDPDKDSPPISHFSAQPTGSDDRVLLSIGVCDADLAQVSIVRVSRRANGDVRALVTPVPVTRPCVSGERVDRPGAGIFQYWLTVSDDAGNQAKRGPLPVVTPGNDGPGPPDHGRGGGNPGMLGARQADRHRITHR